MASKRALRRRTCTGKKHFDCRERALEVKHMLPFGKDLDAYKCPFCGGWCLGHRPGSSNTTNKRVLRGEPIS